jgi:hypothetical protein
MAPTRIPITVVKRDYQTLVQVVRQVGPLAICSERFAPATLHHTQWFICRRSHVKAAARARVARRVFTG